MAQVESELQGLLGESLEHIRLPDNLVHICHDEYQHRWQCYTDGYIVKERSKDYAGVPGVEANENIDEKSGYKSERI